jgi:hypothetical protein
MQSREEAEEPLLQSTAPEGSAPPLPQKPVLARMASHEELDAGGIVYLLDHQAEGTIDLGERNESIYMRFLRFVGPGILVAIGFLDPGNLEADLQQVRGAGGGEPAGWGE